MNKQVELTPFKYFFENTKLFFRFIVAHYRKDGKELEKIYFNTLELYEKYVNTYYNDNEKINIYKEIIYELLELLDMQQQNEVIEFDKDIRKIKGLKLKEKIINNKYVELWGRGKNLWLYIFENNEKNEMFIPYDIEKPYLIDIEQVYNALKDKMYSINQYN